MLRAFTAALVAAFAWAGASFAEDVRPGDVALPLVEGPIAQNQTSYPFNAAAHTRLPQDLARQGYVEEEYFLHGAGRIYDEPEAGRLTALGAGPYVTRILVRRPADARRFNGAVVVEPFNPSHMVDVDLMWILSRNHFMRRGYAWIGVTVKPIAGAALRRFNATRYHAISFANPLPGTERCADLELGPEARDTEIGFAFDILSQLGALVRANAPGNPLRAFNVTRVYLTGYSQTAGLARSYAVAVSRYATRDGGERIYDGYLYGGHAPFNVLFNNCGEIYAPGDPRLIAGPVDAPLIEVAVEGDVPVTHFLRRADSDAAPDLYRRYEVAGATHSGSLIAPYTPRADDFARAGGFETSVAGCIPADAPLSDFPLNDVMNAAWENLDDWSVRRQPPPRAERLDLSRRAGAFEAAGGLAIARDRFGNATGGVRSVAVEVPTTRWHGARGGLDRCMRTGYGEPFDRSTLKALYPSHEDYIRRVRTAVERLRIQRWLTREDGEDIIDAARRASIP